MGDRQSESDLPTFTVAEGATPEQQEILEEFRRITETNPEILLNALSILSMNKDCVPMTRQQPEAAIFQTADTVRALLESRADALMELDPDLEAEILRDPFIALLRQQLDSLGSNNLRTRSPEATEKLRHQMRLRNLAVFAGRAVIAQSVNNEYSSGDIPTVPLEEPA